jgi:hypothetical protein
MEHEAPALFVALEQSAFGAAIRQSLWLYPLANVGHIVALVCFAGALAVMDLRLIGAFPGTAPAPLIARARRIVIAALATQAATGFILFSAEAGHVVLNPVFQLKMAFVATGLLNVALFELVAKRKVFALPTGAPMPSSARVTGFLSLAIWLCVAALGRTIAYF